MLKNHIKTIRKDALTTGYIISCSCGDRWAISAQEFADGNDKYDMHVKNATGKYPVEHD